MLRTIVATLLMIPLALPVNAAWFARLDSAGKLVVTAVATDENNVSYPITITCSKGQFTIEVLTRSNALDDDLETYSGGKLLLGYKLKGGEVSTIKVDGTPIIVAGGVLGIVGELSTDQSKAILGSIGKGYRLDVEIEHPDLPDDVGNKRVTAENYSQVLVAISDHCEGIS